MGLASLRVFLACFNTILCIFSRIQLWIIWLVSTHLQSESWRVEERVVCENACPVCTFFTLRACPGSMGVQQQVWGLGDLPISAGTGQEVPGLAFPGAVHMRGVGSRQAQAEGSAPRPPRLPALSSQELHAEPWAPGLDKSYFLILTQCFCVEWRDSTSSESALGTQSAA